MFVCKGCSSKFMASERVKFVTAFILTCGFCKFAYIKTKFNAQAYATRDMHFVRLMFKAELINF